MPPTRISRSRVSTAGILWFCGLPDRTATTTQFYVIRESTFTERVQVEPNKPLIYRDLRRVRLSVGDTIDLSTGEASEPWIPLFVTGTIEPEFDPTDPYKEWEMPSAWIIRGDAGEPSRTSS